jgi:RNA polymerase sigma-70 factor (ECF subfamily)
MDCSMTATELVEKCAPANIDDAQLAGRFARGDEGAFEEVVLLYQERVARLAHRLLAWKPEAEDVVQDVFLSALQARRRFKGDSSLWTWLTRITINRCRAYQRMRWLRLKSLQQALGLASRRPATGGDVSTSRHAPPADQRCEADETCAIVRAAVAALEARDREAVVLFHLEHRSVADITALTGDSGGAVQVRLHRARKRLKASLADFMKDER